MEALSIIFISIIVVLVIYAHIYEYITMYRIELDKYEKEVEPDIYEWIDVYRIKKRKFLFFWVYEKRKKVCHTNKPLEFLTLKDAEDALKSITSGYRSEYYMHDFKIIRRKYEFIIKEYDYLNTYSKLNTYIKKRKWGVFWVYLRNKDSSKLVFDKLEYAEQFLLDGKHLPKKTNRVVKSYKPRDF